MLLDDHMTMDTMDNTQVTGPKLPPKKCHPGSPPFDPFLQGDHVSWPHLSQKNLINPLYVVLYNAINQSFEG